MPPRKITLPQLFRLAGKDKRFFDAVLSNPRKALQAKKVTLAPEDLRSLERSLRKVYKISGKDLAKIFLTATSGPHPWGKRIIPWI
jgi:hypothetical protein